MPHIEIPANEVATTRVFSLSMAPDAALNLRQNSTAQAALLGEPSLAPGGIELFALSDLGDLGLAGYLRDGIDAQEADLKRDRAKLAALEGWVMLVHSSAFAGKAAVLRPDAALTLIGTYAQTPADSTPLDLQAEAAQPYSGISGAHPPPPTNTSRASGSLMVAILVGIAALILWLALS